MREHGAKLDKQLKNSLELACRRNFAELLRQGLAGVDFRQALGQAESVGLPMSVS
jgi:hypothetical protein